MIRPGSPFAALYLSETLEKLGMEDAMVREIYRNYLPMLEGGVTTVCENFDVEFAKNDSLAGQTVVFHGARVN